MLETWQKYVCLSGNIHMVTLNKIIVGNSWKCTFWACNFQKFFGGHCPQTPLGRFISIPAPPPPPPPPPAQSRWELAVTPIMHSHRRLSRALVYSLDTCHATILSMQYKYTAISIKVVPEQSGKVEYERKSRIRAQKTCWKSQKN
jgi:hypothetical protein